MSAETPPFVSVIMPVRNERSAIVPSLRAVMNQSYPAERLEVLVVDGGSTDGTPEVVGSIFAEAPDGLSTRLLSNPVCITPAGLNVGIREARGDVLIRVDGHCEIAPDYVETCVRVLEATGADNVGGVQRAVGDRPVAKAIALATTSRFGAGDARFRFATEPGWVDTVYLGAYRRDVFDRIGGFDERFVRDQDDEFNLRLTRSGGRIWLDPSIGVTYRPRSSLRSLWRQYHGYGRYKVMVMRKHGYTAWRHFVPPTFVIALVVSAAVWLVRRSTIPFALVGGVYTSANVVSSAVVSRGDTRSALLLPAVFACIHIAYGVGILRGLLETATSSVSAEG